MNFANVITRIKESKQEFFNVKSLVGVSLLTALNVAAGAFEIQLTPLLKIGFASVFAGASGMFFGPLPTAFACVIADHLKFLINPGGPYFIGFPINELLIGFIYGCFFYKQKVTLKRTIAARLTVTVLINLILTPLWLNIMYQNPLFTTVRIVKNILMFPFDVAILHVVLKATEKIKIRR